VIKFAEDTGCMPTKDRWCNDAIEHTGITEGPVKLEGSPRPKWDLAYNACLSGREYAEIAREAVLLFEADGPWNYSGGPELLKPKRLKDRFLGIVPIELDFTLVAIVDGTVGRYRFSDGAIAVYDAESREFAPFTTESKYVPLRWEPVEDEAGETVARGK
jgi:hypothetical protein